MPLVQEELIAFPGEHDEGSAIFAHFEAKLLVEGPRADDVAYEDFDDQLLGRIHVGRHGCARVAGYTSWERCPSLLLATNSGRRTAVLTGDPPSQSATPPIHPTSYGRQAFGKIQNGCSSVC